MAEKLDPRQVVTFEELVMSVMYEQEARKTVMGGRKAGQEYQ
ncbi:MAG: hypothetical protein O6929_07880 [candidate division NC10 bacterium]|nr:hypothetical protein [candidate division NC10 bacterium]